MWSLAPTPQVRKQKQGKIETHSQGHESYKLKSRVQLSAVSPTQPQLSSLIPLGKPQICWVSAVARLRQYSVLIVGASSNVPWKYNISVYELKDALLLENISLRPDVAFMLGDPQITSFLSFEKPLLQMCGRVLFSEHISSSHLSWLQLQREQVLLGRKEVPGIAGEIQKFTQQNDQVGALVVPCRLLRHRRSYQERVVQFIYQTGTYVK